MLVKYNGVELPDLPDGITLDEYPYIWIRKNDAEGSYDLAVSTHIYYYNYSSNKMVTSSGTEPLLMRTRNGNIVTHILVEILGLLTVEEL